MRQASILAMADDNERARKAFARFLKVHNLSGRGISRAAGMSPSAASQFIQGNARSPKADTMRNFAKGATELLGRPVSTFELVGDKMRAEMFADFGGHLPAGPPPKPRPTRDDQPETPIRHYVGAGDEVHLFDGDGGDAIDHTPAPPGFHRNEGAAVIVRGESMRPIYDPGDMLFFRHRRDPPATPKELPIRAVIVQVKTGPLYVKKLLPGTKKGRFHLLSINPLTPIMQDQVVESFAYIEWVKPRAL